MGMRAIEKAVKMSVRKPLRVLKRMRRVFKYRVKVGRMEEEEDMMVDGREVRVKPCPQPYPPEPARSGVSSTSKTRTATHSSTFERWL